MKEAKFDQKFDVGDQITDQLDLKKARRRNGEAKRVKWRTGSSITSSIPGTATLGG
jgi:hypothetical protein